MQGFLWLCSPGAPWFICGVSPTGSSPYFGLPLEWNYDPQTPCCNLKSPLDFLAQEQVALSVINDNRTRKPTTNRPFALFTCADPRPLASASLLVNFGIFRPSLYQGMSSLILPEISLVRKPLQRGLVCTCLCLPVPGPPWMPLSDS